MPLPPLPGYAFAESAVRALGHAARHSAWLRRPPGKVRQSAVEAGAARAVAVEALARQPGGGWLDAADAALLVAAAGVPLCPAVPVGTVDKALAAADRVGYPVALKTAAAIAHKTEAGGVRVGLRNAHEVRSAYPSVAAGGGDQAAGVMVQPMVSPGVELLVGVTRVEPYPPLVLVGLGGTATELLGDTAVRLAPLSDVDAREAVRELRAAPLLLGHRGQPAADVAAVEDLLLRVGELADEVPELAELDLNPVVVRPDGVVAVDVKARLAPVAPHEDLLRDPLVRRLR